MRGGSPGGELGSRELFGQLTGLAGVLFVMSRCGVAGPLRHGATTCLPVRWADTRRGWRRSPFRPWGPFHCDAGAGGARSSGPLTRGQPLTSTGHTPAPAPAPAPGASSPPVLLPRREAGRAESAEGEFGSFGAGAPSGAGAGGHGVPAGGAQDEPGPGEGEGGRRVLCPGGRRVCSPVPRCCRCRCSPPGDRVRGVCLPERREPSEELCASASPARSGRVEGGLPERGPPVSPVGCIRSALGRAAGWPGSRGPPRLPAGVRLPAGGG